MKEHVEYFIDLWPTYSIPLGHRVRIWGPSLPRTMMRGITQGTSCKAIFAGQGDDSGIPSEYMC
jgi:hypothetical protein